MNLNIYTNISIHVMSYQYYIATDTNGDQNLTATCMYRILGIIFASVKRMRTRTGSSDTLFVWKSGSDGMPLIRVPPHKGEDAQVCLWMEVRLYRV